MNLRIDHVSLAVRNYEKAVEFFTKILGAIPQTHGYDNNLKYYWELFTIGDLSRFEIIRATDKDSFLKNFLKNKEGGIHHIDLHTSDIEMTRLFLEQNNIPYFDFRNSGSIWKELFIHPKDAFGVLIQIAEFRPDDWLAPSHKLPKEKKWEFTKESEGYLLNFAHPGGGKFKLNLDKKDLKKMIQDLKNLIE